MKKTILIILTLFVTAGVCYSQAPVKRQKNPKTEQPQSPDTKRKQEAEARRKREAEAKRQQEEAERLQRVAEAKRQQEEAERLQREAEAKRQQEEAARISDPDGYISDHGYVDLGLPSGLKWATCNVGASSPSDYGNYYAWGETTTKSSYTKKNSLTYNKKEKDLRSSGIIDTAGNLTASHDAARANWGGSWRIPAENEYRELKDKCTWTWMSQGDKKGYKVTGPNGKSIFLPAAQYLYNSSPNLLKDSGYYWSASVYADKDDAYSLFFESPYIGTIFLDKFGRFLGNTVRAVSE